MYKTCTTLQNPGSELFVYIKILWHHNSPQSIFLQQMNCTWWEIWLTTTFTVTLLPLLLTAEAIRLITKLTIITAPGLLLLTLLLLMQQFECQMWCPCGFMTCHVRGKTCRHDLCRCMVCTGPLKHVSCRLQHTCHTLMCEYEDNCWGSMYGLHYILLSGLHVSDTSNSSPLIQRIKK